MPEPQIVLVQVTDTFGAVEAEPLVITVQGETVSLECNGLSMVGFVDEFRAALVEPSRVERAA